MQKKILNSVIILFCGTFITTSAHALTVDWNGFFRADNNFVFDYQLDRAAPGNSNDPNAGGEYIRGEGQKGATFTTFFAKLKPKVLVNDNVIVRSEWNLGDPVAGFFGRGVPRSDQNNSLTTRKDALDISVARLWMDVHTDFGTLQVGRAPMHWGLGTIFNSGDGPFDRFQSTSDTIRLLSKFGYLTLMPLYAKESMGRSLGGTANPLPTADSVGQGSDDVTDYGLALKYENPEEDLDAGAMFYKRNASDGQNTFIYPSTATSYTAGKNGMNLKLVDLYAKKTWRRLEIGGEIPFYSGEIGDVNGVGKRNSYKATALALEAALNYDSWRHMMKVGTVPGQGPTTTGARGEAFHAVYLHRNYKLGQILFRYNLGGFGPVNPDPISPNTYNASQPANPYDAAITNAKYLMLATEKKGEQWSFGAGLVFAKANEVAMRGKDFFNHRTRQWSTAVADQANNMGLEFDLGTKYAWDDNVSFGADWGVLFPGKYFAFINRANVDGNTDTAHAISFSAATTF